jgi:hypothetical protein
MARNAYCVRAADDLAKKIAPGAEAISWDKSRARTPYVHWWAEPLRAGLLFLIAISSRIVMWSATKNQ